MIVPAARHRPVFDMMQLLTSAAVNAVYGQYLLVSTFVVIEMTTCEFAQLVAACQQD
jgi:hypothetical protein